MVFRIFLFLIVGLYLHAGFNFKPIAKVSYTVDGNTVKFVNESYDIDGKIVKSIWNFGDGVSFDDNSKEIFHTYYSNECIFLISLEVHDDKNEFVNVRGLIDLGSGCNIVPIVQSINPDIMALDTGWNLVKVPTSSVTTLQNLEELHLNSSIISFFGYKNSNWIDKNNSYYNFTQKDGIWIYTNDMTYVYVSDLMPNPISTIEAKKGWSLSGNPLNSNISLVSFTKNGCDIYLYKNSNWEIFKSDYDGTYKIGAFDGFWLKCSEDKNITVIAQ